jgi:hypothetical protein
MILLIIISILYAIIRAKHDSYVNNGPWKLWAFIEGVLVAVGLAFAIGTSWLDYIFLPVIFAMIFWIVFDMACGIFRVGKPFYFGSGKFDQLMRKVFVTGGGFLFWKSIWLIIIIGVYNSLKTL